MSPEKVETAVRTWWPLLAVLVAVAVAWGGSMYQLSSIAAAQLNMAGKLDRALEGLAGQVAGNQAHDRDIEDLRRRMALQEARR